MAEIIEDRVKQVSTSTGLGDFVVAGIVPGFRPFSLVMQAGDTFHGAIVAVDATGAPTGEWEVGYYNYKGSNVIGRDLVRASSATSNAKVSFGPGTKHVFLDLTAYQIRQFAIAGNAGTAVAPFGQNPLEYTSLTFQEEFSGTTFDTTKWNDQIYYKANNATKNYSVVNGNMNIYPQVDAGGQFFDRTFVTDGRFEQLYGYFEIEAKLPIGAGLNPRFNLYNNDEHEFAVMTALCGAPQGQWATADLHPIDFMMNRYTDFRGSVPDEQRARSFMTVPDLSASFHKYGMRWDSNTVRWFFDGVQVGPTLQHTAMRVPMYLYFGLWMKTDGTVATVGSGTLSASNRFTPQGVANSFQVNYVRAWQLA